jgi:hypothetical protein
MNWQPIETAPKERIGPASYQNHGPRILVAIMDSVEIARWDWHKNNKTGNWKRDDGRVTWGEPEMWAPLPVSPLPRR